MKILKVLLALVVLVGGGLLLAMFLLPDHVLVARSHAIAADRATIHALLERPKTWPEWSAWNKTAYPDLEYSYSGAESGVGAVQSWTSKEAGDGSMRITKSDPQVGIEFELTFSDGEPWAGKIAFDDGPDEGTLVTWSFEGDADGLVMKLMMALFRGKMEAEFDAGLRGLEKRATQGTSSPAEAAGAAAQPAG